MPKRKTKARAKRTTTKKSTLKELERVVDTVQRLRAPGGCPWDRKQTHQSLRPFLIEEAYELLEVLDRIGSPRDLENHGLKADFLEELGDVLLQVLLHAEMASEANAFSIADIARGLDEKLRRRHPHVFLNDNQSAYSSDEVMLHWEQIKAQEKAQREQEDLSILSGLPSGLPALQRAGRVIEKVTKVGFQWPDFSGPLDKLDEEFSELRQEIERYQEDPSEEARKRMEEELGDLLFCVANLAFLLKLEPEQALRGNLARFESRFRHVERRLKEMGKPAESAGLDLMDKFWKEAKALEKTRAEGKRDE